jgi:hypothetical protein
MLALSGSGSPAYGPLGPRAAARSMNLAPFGESGDPIAVSHDFRNAESDIAILDDDFEDDIIASIDIDFPSIECVDDRSASVDIDISCISDSSVGHGVIISHPRSMSRI